MEELYFYNIDECVTDKTCLSDYEEQNKWHVIDYETSEFGGRAVVCGEISNPVPVTLDFKVKGWYKIYLGMLNPTWTAATTFDINGFGRTIVETPVLDWEPNTWLQETFFICCDLTGKQIKISKPLDPIVTSSGIGYVHLVRMTDEEIEAFTKTTGGVMSFHMDQDTFGMETYKSVEDYLSVINILEGFNGGTLYLETTRQSKIFAKKKYGINPLQFTELREKNSKFFDENSDEINGAIIKRAHQMGVQVYSARRIQMGDFQYPVSNQYVNTACEVGNEGSFIKTRDGRDVKVLSYAYEKVREMAVDSIVSSMKNAPFDGVQLFFHRGVFMGFEQPVVDAVRETYGVDARVLPLGDERLNEVYSRFMTAFMLSLRSALDGKFGKNAKKISIVTMYTPENTAQLGVDVEELCKLGLVDDVCQGLMSWKENLKNCLDNDGLVDIEAYKKEYSVRQILERYYDGNNSGIVVEGAVAFKKICDRYGVKFSATLGWNNAGLDYTYDLAKKLHDAGIKNLFSWNMNHKIRRLDLLNTEKDIAVNFDSLGERKKFVKLTRINKFDDKDITYFNSAWNG